MGQKCLKHVLASSYLLPKSSAPNAGSGLEKDRVFSTDRTESLLHHRQRSICIVSPYPGVKPRQVNPTKELDLSFCDWCAVNFGLADSHCAVDRTVGILH